MKEKAPQRAVVPDLHLSLQKGGLTAPQTTVC